MCITSEQTFRVTLFTPSALGTDHVFTGDDLRPQCTKFRGNMPLDVSSMSNKEYRQEVAPIHHNYFPNSSSKDMYHPQSYHLLMTGMAPIKWMKIHSYLFSPALSHPKRGNVSKSEKCKSPATFKHYQVCFHDPTKNNWIVPALFQKNGNQLRMHHNFPSSFLSVLPLSLPSFLPFFFFLLDKNIWNLFVKEHDKWANFEDF